MQTYYHEKALLLIENYLYYMKKPRRNLKMDRFAYRSYAIWAAEELLSYVNEHDSVPPLDAVNEFIKMVDNYSSINKETGFIFSIAKDIAEDIFDMLMSAI